MEKILNVHTYDGVINLKSCSVTKYIDEMKNKSMKEKKSLAKEVLRHGEIYKFSKISIDYLNKIIKDIGTNKNFDPTNNFSVDELICVCWIFRENKNFMKLLEEQLSDMKTGFCPQGRTHRIYQLLLAFL